jgi:hypothetical protein
MHVIRNGPMVVELNESLGGEITRIRHRGRDLLATYQWSAPVGVSQSSSYGDARLDWLSDYRGGWQLLIPNAGAACEVGGLPLPFHGEWSRTRVAVTERAANRIVMTAGTRLPLSVTREIRIETEPDRLLIGTTVSNTSPEVVDFIWGEHPAFAVAHGDEIDLPPTQVFAADGSELGDWPMGRDGSEIGRIDTSQPRESVHYLTGFAEGWAALRRRGHGVALAWDVADFPYAWLWHEIASPGFPFFGRTSLVAIEPASSWPGHGLSAAIERGQAIRLQPGEQRSTTVALIPFDTPTAADGARVTGVWPSGRVDWAAT